MLWVFAAFVGTLRALGAPPVASAAQPVHVPIRQVVDYENLRVVTAPAALNRVPTCQVLVVGGGLGGVAAAEVLAERGVSVILTEPTSHLGGQLTAQGLCTPDENRYIEDRSGPSSRHYRELRDDLRRAYGRMHGIVEGENWNVGRCWVSTISGEPAVWEQVIKDRLGPLMGEWGIREILMRTALLDVQRYAGNGHVSYADFLDLDTGHVIRIGARYVLDATPTGDVLALAGSPWTIGQEARSTYNEPDAPVEAHPEWVQSFTYSFIVRWTPDGPKPIIPKPYAYEFFKSLGLYSLTYHYAGPLDRVMFRMMVTGPETPGPFWTYRRLVAASSFTDNRAYDHDIALINWRGSDYPFDNFVGKTPQEQVRILTRGKAFAQGFLYWLQTECPRDDGKGVGYPEIQPAADELGTDGFAPFPYVRESRRLIAVSPLTERDMVPDPDHPDRTTGTDFFDSVGLALYPTDIHQGSGDTPHAAAVLPYELPLGAFIAVSGPPNVLPASLDLGASRLAAASARVHPTEWLIGEVAGDLAAFCLKHDVLPAEVRDKPELLSDFQDELRTSGIDIRWSEVEGFADRRE
ncbi:MAG: FAD-dependent oxidoreductase [Capsulimonadaceae bacterium]